MAAITTITPDPINGRTVQIRSVSAQATTGQTDWVKVPEGAKFAEVIVNWTAKGGTSPTLLPSVLTADPITMNDADTVVVGSATTTAMTNSGQATRICIGPGVTGIADAVAVGTAGGVDVKLNTILPALLGVKVLNTRTNGNETYTYTVSVRFTK